MKKHVLTLYLIVGMCLALVACNEASDDSSKINTDSVKATESNKDKDVEEKSTDNDKPGKDLSIPDDIPADFPFPEGIVITDIEDKSDGDKVEYQMDISFDNIDVDAVFDMYREYSEKIDYSIVNDGEVNAQPDVYQFATFKTSTDMFVITLRPKEENGVIQIVVGK